VRGATFGAVEGFGDEADIRARAEVSEELSPVTSAIASIAPDVGVAALTGGLGGLATGAGRAAGRAALAEGAGLVRAGLAAGRAGGAAALAAESAGTGLVGAGQAAYAEGRELGDDPGRDAENALIWGGLNFGLGASMFGAARLARRGERDAIEATGEELADVVAAAEVRAMPDAEARIAEASTPGTPGQIYDIEGAAPAAVTEPSAGYQRARAIMDRMRSREAQAGSVDLGQPVRSRDEVLDGLEQVWTPEEKQVAHGYTHARFYEANEALRGQAPMTPDVQADVERLSSLFGKAVDNGATYDGKTIRGIGLTPDEAAQLDSAGVLTAQGFMSSSTDPKVAKQFTNFGSTSERDVPVLFEIEGRSGVPIGRGQAEVVHRPGTQFSVLGKRMDGDVPVYELREMGYQPGAPSDAIMGSVAVPDGAGFSLSGLATSPMGNVIASGAGAAIGGAVGGEEGAMIGAGLGFGASFLAPSIRAAAARIGERESVERGIERALRNASESEADELVDEALRETTSSAPTGSKKGAAPKPVEAPTPEANSFGRQRRLYINRNAILDVAEREMSADLGSLVKDVDQVTRAEKLATVSSNVIENLPAQRAVAQGVAQDAAQLVGELKAEARAYAKATGQKGLQYAVEGQQRLSLDLLDHAEQIAEAKNGKALFEAIDALKRTAQEHKLALEEGMINATNAIHHQKLIPRIDQFAQRVRTALEDAGVWGKAGSMQRDYNAVISDQLLPHMRVFERSVLERTSKGYDGIWNVEGWETKIRALLKGNDPGKVRHVNAVLDAMDDLASVRRKYGDEAVATRIEERTSKIRRTMGLADEVFDATGRMKALGELIGGVPMGGAIAGGLAGGIPGAAIGAALPGAVRGLVMGDLIEAFQRLSGASERAAQRGVDDWVRSSRIRGQGLKVPRVPPLTEAGRQLRDVAARRGVTQSMALFMGDDESPHAAFVRWRDAVLDQPGFFKGLGQDYQALQNEAPEVFMAIGGRSDLARRFLAERMPPNTGVSMANPEGYLPSRDSIEDWALYVNAVRFPMRVLRNIGGAYMQEIETLRTVYPRVHEMAQQQVLRAMAKANTAGESLDDTFYARAALLFPEVDGLGSPIFSRDFGRFVAEYNAEQKDIQMQKAGGGTGKPRTPPLSPTQHTIQSGATYGAGLA
jgi:hypothetical protein